MTATSVTAAPMSTSDTIAAADIPASGALLNVINASGAPIQVKIVDPNTTPAGNTATAPDQPVAAAGDRWFKVKPEHVNPNTGLATVTLSSATSVTYKLIKP